MLKDKEFILVRILKYEILKAQSQSVPVNKKIGRHERRPEGLHTVSSFQMTQELLA